MSHRSLVSVPFEKAKLHVPLEAEAWPKDRDERVIVNSFGIGGANALVSNLLIAISVLA